MKIITTSDSETQKEGEKFAEKLKPMDVVFLIGDLGSGKTTFAKGLAKGLGIDSRVISPTFVVVRRHSIQAPKSDMTIHTLYHLDLYRLKNEKEVLSVDLKDYLDDQTGVTVIEWPEISQDIVGKKVWKVLFAIQKNESREIEFKYE